MYIVQNNTKSVHSHTLAGPTPTTSRSVRLLPGTNEVPDADWEALIAPEGSMVRRMVDEFVTDDGRPMLEAEKSGAGGFQAMPAAKAIAFVRRCGDLAKLQTYVAHEMRPAVAEALRLRIAKLTPSAKQKNDDDDETAE